MLHTFLPFPLQTTILLVYILLHTPGVLPMSFLLIKYNDLFSLFPFQPRPIGYDFILMSKKLHLLLVFAITVSCITRTYNPTQAAIVNKSIFKFAKNKIKAVALSGLACNR